MVATIGVAEFVESQCMLEPYVLERQWELTSLSGIVVVVARKWRVSPPGQWVCCIVRVEWRCRDDMIG